MGNHPTQPVLST